MKTLFSLSLAILALGVKYSQAAVADSTQPMKIQVVFALDATGSMSGLISAAKQKIWSIAGSLAQAKPTPQIEMGMVFYRDKGDAFVTQVLPLTKDLDGMYSKLMEIQAQGGGDGPESVNKGLYDAVNTIQWSGDTNVIKSLFLVGDFPPHMDYKDDVKYYTTCKAAKEKDIVINTILMGNNNETRVIWKEIASCSGGEFIETNMNANNTIVKSPYDATIKSLSSQLDEERMFYGSKTDEKKKMEETEKFKTLNFEDGSKRADYNMLNETNKSNYYGEQELVYAVSHHKVKLEDIKEEELPGIMKSMSKEERITYLDKKIALRDSLEKNMEQLLKQRQEYLQKEMSKTDKEEDFNSKVFNGINRSARKKGYRTVSCPRF